jgi:hypothetical protein
MPVDEDDDPLSMPVDEDDDPLLMPVDEDDDPLSMPVDEDDDPISMPVDEDDDPLCSVSSDGIASIFPVSRIPSSCRSLLLTTRISCASSLAASTASCSLFT